MPTRESDSVLSPLFGCKINNVFSRLYAASSSICTQLRQKQSRLTPSKKNINFVGKNRRKSLGLLECSPLGFTLLQVLGQTKHNLAQEATAVVERRKFWSKRVVLHSTDNARAHTRKQSVRVQRALSSRIEYKKVRVQGEVRKSALCAVIGREIS